MRFLRGKGRANGKDELNQKHLVTATDVLKKNAFFSLHSQIVIFRKA